MVSKPRPQYPSVAVSLMDGLVSTVRSSFLGALFCTYVVMNDSFGLPPLVRWVEAGAGVPLPSAVADRIVALAPGVKAWPAPPGSLFGAGDATGVQLRLVPVRDVVELSPAGKWLDGALFAAAPPTALNGSAAAPVTPRRAVDNGGYRKTLVESIVLSLLTTAVHAALYFSFNFFFLFCDVTGLLSRYRLPRTKRMMPSRRLIVSTIVEGCIGTLLLMPVGMIPVYAFLVRCAPLLGAPASATPDGVALPSIGTGQSTLPSLGVLTGHIAAAVTFNAVAFYIAHRLLHEVPGLYAAIHKQHHKYVGTIGFAAEYAHPVEQVFANYIPTAGYCLLFVGGLHPAIWVTFLAMRTQETYEAHSGYCFSDSIFGRIGLTYGEHAEFHDWHHSDNRGAYGIHWLDCLCRTCDSFVLMKARQRAGKKATASTLTRH